MKLGRRDPRLEAGARGFVHVLFHVKQVAATPKFLSSFWQIFHLFCQAFPNVFLAILRDIKGLRGSNLTFGAFFESPNFLLRHGVPGECEAFALATPSGLSREAVVKVWTASLSLAMTKSYNQREKQPPNIPPNFPSLSANFSKFSKLFAKFLQRFLWRFWGISRAYEAKKAFCAISKFFLPFCASRLWSGRAKRGTWEGRDRGKTRNQYSINGGFRKYKFGSYSVGCWRV